MVVNHVDIERPSTWLLSFASLSLILLAGIASGLTVGFLGLDPTDMKIISAEGGRDKRMADAVLPIIREKHQLMVTLLLTNAVAMETLPLCLDRLFSPLTAIVLSVTMILLFGEIIPQAMTTGPNQLKMCYYSLPLMRFLSIITFPVAVPVAVLLDKIIGADDERTYGRKGLKMFITLQQRSPELPVVDCLTTSLLRKYTNNSMPDDRHRMILVDGKNELDPLAATSLTSESTDNGGVVSDTSTSTSSAGGLIPEEVRVITGALELGKKRVIDVMTPSHELYMLEENDIITQEVRVEIVSKGFSRVPVYRRTRDEIVGTILVKRLVTSIENRAAWEVIEMTHNLLFMGSAVSLWTALTKFQRGCHIGYVVEDTMAYHSQNDSSEVVNPRPKRLLGVLTLEDVIEEVLQEEIYDEFDELIPRQTTPNSVYRTQSQILRHDLSQSI